jgi:VTC domain
VSSFVPDLSSWTAISLDELNRRAPLLDRGESKYVVNATQFTEVLARLRTEFDVLAIGDTRVFAYETTYFDTPELLTYRDHAQGRRRRFKVRSRRYVDSNLCYFEVKLKGVRDRTIKERMPYAEALHGSVSAEADEFVRSCVRRVYGQEFEGPLLPSLAMSYRRLTLVGKNCSERVTVDFDLNVRGHNSIEVATPRTTIVLEVKSQSGDGRADEVIRSAGIRPQSCSKYCVGLNLVRDGLSYNEFNRTLRTYFAWPGPSPRGEIHPRTVDQLSPNMMRAYGLATHTLR